MTVQDTDAVAPGAAAAGSQAPTATTRQVPAGDPGPWAILAFSTTSFMLGLFNAGLVNEDALGLVIPMAFVYGGAIQVIVAVLEVFRGNVFGAALFGSFGPFWIIYGLIEQSYAAEVTAKGGDAAVASGLTVFLGMFTVLAVFFAIAALRTDAVIFTVVSLIVVGLVVLMLATSSGSAALEHVSGYVILLFAILGWYRALAGLLNSMWGRTVLPVWPLGAR